MRTTTLQRRPEHGSATVTNITARRVGRPPQPRPFITEDIREGALVARFRDDLGMSQAVLAARAGLSRSALALYETGHKHIPDMRIEALADALGVEPWLIRIIQTLPLDLKVA